MHPIRGGPLLCGGPPKGEGEKSPFEKIAFEIQSIYVRRIADGCFFIDVRDSGSRGENADALAGRIRKILPAMTVARPSQIDRKSVV